MLTCKLSITFGNPSDSEVSIRNFAAWIFVLTLSDQPWISTFNSFSLINICKRSLSAPSPIIISFGNLFILLKHLVNSNKFLIDSKRPTKTQKSLGDD